MLWRLANQSFLAEILAEMHAAGFVDVDLGASLRATSVQLMTLKTLAWPLNDS